MREAMLYEKLEGGKARCNLCSHHCLIGPSQKGICGVRENRGGTLYSLVYEKAISWNVDPIEKKPLFHLFPGSRSLSLATVGCNFRCSFCQNYNISQVPVDEGKIAGYRITPQEFVDMALKYECKSIAYTYTEPTIFFEYAYETAKIGKEAGLRNIFVTNGYMTKEALEEIRPFLDAANVDLKSFREEFYHKLVGAKLGPVLDSLRQFKEMGIWVEVTTLIIPTLNDSSEELEEIAKFVLSLGEETPWHISAFYPAYKCRDLPPTSASALKQARQIGIRAGLRYVYTGNIPGEEGENTYCYQCKKRLIHRWGFTILENLIDNSHCPFCGAKIDGIGM